MHNQDKQLQVAAKESRIKMHKNMTTTVCILHKTTELENTTTKQPYCIDILII